MLNASRTYLAVGGEGVRLGDRGRVGGREAEGGDGGDAKHRERRARGYDDADVLIAFSRIGKETTTQLTFFSYCVIVSFFDFDVERFFAKVAKDFPCRPFSENGPFAGRSTAGSFREKVDATIAKTTKSIFVRSSGFS